MLSGLWRSYKQFCVKLGKEFKFPSIWSAILVFPIIFYGFWWLFLFLYWFTGTVWYSLWGMCALGLSFCWWLIRLLFYLVRVLIAVLRKKEPPMYPASSAKRSRNMSGMAFEQYVADRLRARGYHDVQFTPATGDYGVDILATKHGKVYAFQCKCYTGSVGVSAVQEVFSGSRKYQADRAVVITNSRYTPNARTLAGDLGVSLWDLEVLDSIFCE